MGAFEIASHSKVSMYEWLRVDDLAGLIAQLVMQDRQFREDVVTHARAGGNPQLDATVAEASLPWR